MQSVHCHPASVFTIRDLTRLSDASLTSSQKKPPAQKWKFSKCKVATVSTQFQKIANNRAYIQQVDWKKCLQMLMTIYSAMLVLWSVDRQSLKSAAELSTLLALVARGVNVLCLDVEVEVGTLHHNVTDGALPVGSLQPQHHGSDLCTGEHRHNS